MQWYQEWFNSPYYHILYKQRDDKEAQLFIQNFLNTTLIKPQSKILDIACGRGRHAVYLNQQRFDVTGIDLSADSIAFAKQLESDSLHFFEHDMRNPLCSNYFDIALNLFTSFGYFDTHREHLKALKNFKMALKPNGLFVLDYFNTTKIKKQLVPTETKHIEGITFYISKKVEQGKIVKTIQFEDNAHFYTFEEKVSALERNEFEELLQQAGFRIIRLLGSYHLEEYSEQVSDRLIFICQS